MSQLTKLDKVAAMVFWITVGTMLAPVVTAVITTWCFFVSGWFPLESIRERGAVEDVMPYLPWILLPAMAGAFAGFRVARRLTRNRPN